VGAGAGIDEREFIWFAWVASSTRDA
jgi:hypothetical protein